MPVQVLFSLLDHCSKSVRPKSNKSFANSLGQLRQSIRSVAIKIETVPHSPKFHIISMSPDRFNVHQLHHMAGLKWYQDSKSQLTSKEFMASGCMSSAERFVEWAQNEIAVVPDFHKRILFRDEAHFWLNGYVNKQNCRIWSEANPQEYAETPLHPEKLTVWCALWAGGILLQKR
ncbi:putative transposable element [Trichonephila clavipes]|nr:putative transposable element [Trichonephila clavipes]